MNDLVGQIILNFLTHLNLFNPYLAKILASFLNNELHETTQWIIRIILYSGYDQAVNTLYEALADEGYLSE